MSVMAILRQQSPERAVGPGEGGTKAITANISKDCSTPCHDAGKALPVASKSNAGGYGKRETLISPKYPPRLSAANMNASSPLPQRKIFGRLSIIAGNALQFAGIVAAFSALALARSQSQSAVVAAILMIAAWFLLYLFCHGIAHWAVGRLLGIRFAFYTIGGTGNPEGYPAGMRWVFEHLPFFGVQTDKTSMQKASPMAKAIMWSAGVTSSAIVPILSTVCAWRAGIPGGKLFLIFAVFWAIGTLSSNWRSQTGDYAKSKRALHT